MPRMPDFEHEILDDLARAGHHVTDWFRRDQHDTQTPATMPATMKPATQQEETMSLATIAADIKSAIGNAEQWVTQVTETHLPAILAEAGKYEGSTIGKLAQTLEGTLIPEPFETMLNGLVEDFVKRYGQPAVAAPADPSQAPAEAPVQ